MVVNVTNQLMRVHFYYSPAVTNVSRYSYAIVEVLSSMDNWVVKLRGMAKCHPRDQFARRTGRRLALTRALENEDKTFRSEVWRALFKKGMKP